MAIMERGCLDTDTMSDTSRPTRRATLYAGLVIAICAGVVACGDDADDRGTADAPSSVSVGDTAGLIQATADAVWVATNAGVVRIDPESNAVVATVATLVQPEYIVSDGTSLWASLFQASQIVRIDPATNSVTETLDVPDNPSGAVVVGNDIWVTSHRGAAVLRFSAGQTEAIASIAVGELGPDGPLGIAAGIDSIWVGTPNIFAISQIDPITNDVIAEFGIPPGANPCGDIAVVDEHVQVSSCRLEPSISVIDPASGSVQVVQLGGLGIAVAVVDDAAWWAVQADGRSHLVRVDNDSGSLTVVDVPGVSEIGGVAVAFGYVWVSDEANGSVTRFPLSLIG